MTIATFPESRDILTAAVPKFRTHANVEFILILSAKTQVNDYFLKSDIQIENKDGVCSLYKHDSFRHFFLS